MGLLVHPNIYEEIQRLFSVKAGLEASNAPSRTLDFTGFKKSLWPKYRHWAHLNIIDQYLEQVVLYLLTNGEQGIGRLMINCPPQYGKSTTVSQYFPAYVIGKMTWVKLMLVSYGDGLARRNSRAVRKIIQSQAYQEIFPGVRLDRSKKAANEFEIEGTGGEMFSTGILGGATGHPSNLLIVDDPIKNRAEAESPTIRERTRDAFYSDIYTRLGLPGAIVFMNTRWNYEDLSGTVLNDPNEQYVHVNLPAIAEENDIMGRQPGQALWPEKHNEEKLAQIRASMGDYAFASLFQQSPLQTKGRLFDTGKIRIVKEAPEIVRTVRFYDLAVTTKSRSSWTVGFKLGITKDEMLVILHVWRAQLEAPDVHEKIVQNAMIDGKDVRIRLEAEKGGIVELQYMLRDPRLRAFTMDAKPPHGDKYARAGAPAARVNGERVLMVEGAWNRELLDELSMFPASTNTDQVDGFSGAYQMLTETPAKLEVTKNPFYGG